MADMALREKCPNRVFSAPYFPIFGLNTEIYSVNLGIQYQCTKIRTRKNSVFGYFTQWNQSIVFLEWFRCFPMLQIKELQLLELCVFILYFLFKMQEIYCSYSALFHVIDTATCCFQLFIIFQEYDILWKDCLKK